MYVYILQSQKTGSYYIGQTKDTAERLTRHNGGEVPSTKSKGPWTMIWRIEQQSDEAEVIIQ